MVVDLDRLPLYGEGGLFEILEGFPDTRKRRGLRHSIESILAISLCAVLAGARSFVAIAEWGADPSPGTLRGSGTTGHAVMAQNAADGGTRRYILVQLPEPLDPANRDQKVAAEFCDKLGKPRTIAELTKERLRRAGKKIKEENPMFAGDTGFRVFKLDSSNLRAWDPHPADLEGALLEHMEHIVPGRTEQDVLYELLLKLGLDLCVPIQEKEVRSAEATGKAHTVYSVGGGVLMACLSERIGREEVEPLAMAIVEWRTALAPAGDTTCVFRDSAFADDVAKTNLADILEQHGIANIRNL